MRHPIHGENVCARCRRRLKTARALLDHADECSGKRVHVAGRRVPL